MATMDFETRDRLEREIAAIGRDCPAPGTKLPAPPAEPVMVSVGNEALVKAEPFGRWLLSQKDRGDWIDELATAARKDPGFPKTGGPEDVRRYMGARGIGDPDVFEQIDDAERCWISC